jgi:hypothetical protein
MSWLVLDLRTQALDSSHRVSELHRWILWAWRPRQTAQTNRPFLVVLLGKDWLRCAYMMTCFSLFHGLGEHGVPQEIWISTNVWGDVRERWCDGWACAKT